MSSAGNNVTIHELAKKIEENCPPSSPERVVVSDKTRGVLGPLVNIRYVHTGVGMVLELVVDGGSS